MRDQKVLGTATPGGVLGAQRRLTSGVLAVHNLHAQIEGRARLVSATKAASVEDRAELVELLELRGHLLGRICDYEWAEKIAEQLTRDEPGEGIAFLSRARVRALFHRFPEALADLDEALRLGADPDVVALEHATILQAIGLPDPILDMCGVEEGSRADFDILATAAMLHAERGEITDAEPLFEECTSRYRAVSPIPLALLDYQRGRMWFRHGDLNPALTWFETAVRLLPAYAPAQGHLARVEAALGEHEYAIDRLLPLTTSSDDPDYAASLARVLADAGREREALNWREQAARRYHDLITLHPEAFAHHAAEFGLASGRSPNRSEHSTMKAPIGQMSRASEFPSDALGSADSRRKH